MDAVTIVQSQARVQRKTLKIRSRINVDLPELAVLEHFDNADVGLEVDDGHVRLHGGPVKRSRSSLAPVFARLVPWRGTNGKALGAGHNLVESVQRGSRDERGLVVDPQVAHRVEAVGEDDALGV